LTGGLGIESSSHRLLESGNQYAWLPKILQHFFVALLKKQCNFLSMASMKVLVREKNHRAKQNCDFHHGKQWMEG
jgi:hypothetical protein